METIRDIEEIKLVARGDGYQIDFVIRHKPFPERHNIRTINHIEMFNLKTGSGFSLEEPKGFLFRFKKPHSCVITDFQAVCGRSKRL